MHIEEHVYGNLISYSTVAEKQLFLASFEVRSLVINLNKFSNFHILRAQKLVARLGRCTKYTDQKYFKCNNRMTHHVPPTATVAG